MDKSTDGDNFDVNLNASTDNMPTSLSSDAFKNCKLSKNLSKPICNAVIFSVFDGITETEEFRLACCS